MCESDGSLSAACKRCGKNLPKRVTGTRGPGRVFCSSECSRYQRLSRQGKIPRDSPRPCQHCGKNFVPPKKPAGFHKYCSDECRRNQARPPQPPTPCRNCGLPLPETACGNTLYCSPECKAASQLTPAVCEWCDHTFTTIKRSPSRFCSHSCAGRYRHRHKNHPIHECQYCGSRFEHQVGGRRSNKFCSRDCAFEARRVKHPSAIRPRDAWKQLTSWMLGWGDDVYPATVRCDCGRKYQERKKGSPSCCKDCSSYETRRRVERKAERAASLERKLALWSCIDCNSTRGVCVNGWRVSKRCLSCRQKRTALVKREQKRRQGTNFRSRCRRHGVPYEPVNIKEMHEANGWKCYMCGVDLLRKHTLKPGTRTPDPRSPTTDHVIPLAAGPGSPGHVATNVRSCCWRCNCAIKSKHDSRVAAKRLHATP